jgi:hypothetical protein
LAGAALRLFFSALGRQSGRKTESRTLPSVAKIAKNRSGNLGRVERNDRRERDSAKRSNPFSVANVMAPNHALTRILTCQSSLCRRRNDKGVCNVPAASLYRKDVVLNPQRSAALGTP